MGPHIKYQLLIKRSLKSVQLVNSYEESWTFPFFKVIDFYETEQNREKYLVRYIPNSGGKSI